MRPTLCRTAKGGIAQLRNEHGIEPTVDEILWLQDLGRRVERPIDADRAELVGAPVRAGAATLWPMTIAGSIWYLDRACRWWGGHHRLLSYALAYALAHGRDGSLAALDHPTSAAARVVAWGLRNLTCTPGELGDALDDCLRTADDEQPAKPSNRQPVNWTEIVCDLEALTGLPRDYWTARVSRDAAVQAWARARAVAALRGGLSAAGMPDPIDDALRAFQGAIATIIRERKEKEKTAA